MKARSLVRRPYVLLAGILLVSSAVTISAMRRTSPTFDEIVMIAGGARGFQLGRFDLQPDHPPLLQYVYGLPVHLLARPALPSEAHVTDEQRSWGGYRYAYARQLLYGEGNDPERVMFLGRLPAVLFAALLVLMTFVLTRRAYGDRAALLAAVLVAFLPDVLAHGGVAYSDVPLALAFLVALFAVDDVVRTPTPPRGLLAGALVALALCMKVSAAALFPIAAVLLAAEAAMRWRDTAWLKRVALTVPVAAVAAYLTLVLVYLGDWRLEGLEYALEFRFRHVSGGHGAAAFLLGDRSTSGWWYYFPVAFLFKTPAALHALMVLAAGWLLYEVRNRRGPLLGSRLRAPIVGILVFGAALLSANLNIGFRYALPVLPLVCIITAVGVARLWEQATRPARIALAATVVWAVVFPLSYYPHFLAFISEYGPGRDRNYEVLADSSLDWGQGLLELRDFMRDRNIPRVWLSYFGSGMPSGYGIDYVPLASFFPLPPSGGPGGEDPPQYLVISATNLNGLYLPGDPFARFRSVRPDTVLAHTLMVYRLGETR